MPVPGSPGAPKQPNQPHSQPTSAQRADLVAALLAQERPLALVETCTGGALTAAIAGQAGASRVLRWGLTLYDHASKSRFLGLSPDVFLNHGSVSAEAAQAMATAALGQLVASLDSPFEQQAARALAITGIAGPGGGSDAKPVGTCFMALAEPSGTEVREFLFPGSRSTYREQACHSALKWLLATSAHATQGARPLTDSAR